MEITVMKTCIPTTSFSNDKRLLELKHSRLPFPVIFSASLNFCDTPSIICDTMEVHCLVFLPIK